MTKFTRPKHIFPRSDSRVEMDNLFNSLWEASLKPLSSIDKVVFGGQEFI